MSGEALFRQLPMDRESEEAVVGGILFRGAALNQVAEIVRAEDFYFPTHQLIFAAIQDLDSRSRPIDLITVAEQLRVTMDKQGSALSKIQGGEGHLAELASRVATVENITYHAARVRDRSTQRQVLLAASGLATRGYEDHGDVDDYIDDAQSVIFRIANRQGREAYAPVRQVLNTAIRRLESRFANRQVVTGVPTGFEEFDAMTSGLQPGDLIIIAARPSMGKTSFVMNCVQNAALHHNVPCLVFSLEMSKESLLERVLCGEARVNSQALRAGFLTTPDWIRITQASSRISQAPIWIDDSGAPTLMEVRSKCRRWRADTEIFERGAAKPLGLVVVDYLQLIQGRAAGRDSSREREISEISRGLKALGKELGVAVVALSQLNRSLEARADKRPMCSDLRESGAIEQDADLITFIYRDEVYNKDTADKGVAEIIIGKQRQGPTGTVKLAFLNQYTRFENLAQRQMET